MLHFSAVQLRTLGLLKKVQTIPGLFDFYLVVGTALALQFGHRLSIHLDFFTNNEFDSFLILE
jgi:hypothetical protein